MLSFLGPPALSQFRLDHWQRTLQAAHAGVTAISARFVHFVDIVQALEANERELLGKLLIYGPRDETPLPAMSDATPRSGSTLLVTPRIGTVSPWSSKATDIAQVCGLHKIKRLERGTVYSLTAGRSPRRKRATKSSPNRPTNSIRASESDIILLPVKHRKLLAYCQ